MGNFVHRINIREPVDEKLLTVISNPGLLSNHLSFIHTIIHAYEAVGFQFRAEKRSIGQDGTEYMAILVYMEEPNTDDGFSYYDVLTFEKKSNEIEYEFLETFRFPRVPALEHTFNSSEVGFTFDEAWSAATSNFIPESQMEKALFAIGCDFSKPGLASAESIRGSRKKSTLTINSLLSSVPY